ncbi:hypothetical protein D1007_19835 [Hordeum vulgare]|nr:hypothetical protein D1007_19835 [Hordeum vulgare]
MRGWGANLGADLRARKGALLGQLQELDDLADGPGLTPDDWIRRNSLDTSLMDIFKSEELFWQGRGGQNWLLKVSANTAYFQAIANGRRRNVLFLSSGMGTPPWKVQRTSHPIFTPSIRSCSQLSRSEASPCVRTSGR